MIGFRIIRFYIKWSSVDPDPSLGRWILNLLKTYTRKWRCIQPLLSHSPKRSDTFSKNCTGIENHHVHQACFRKESVQDLKLQHDISWPLLYLLPSPQRSHDGMPYVHMFIDWIYGFKRHHPEKDMQTAVNAYSIYRFSGQGSVFWSNDVNGLFLKRRCESM